MASSKISPANTWPQGLKHVSLTPGAARQAGTPLPAGIRQKMEGSLGVDLSAVRVHTNSAVATAGSAQAFTAGQDIFFAPGKYNPDSSEGRRLLAHELTHMVQQKEGSGQ